MSFLCPEDELEHRRNRAREFMSRDSIDCLLISNEENFIHLTGFQGGYGKHMSADRPSILLLPVEGIPVIVTSRLMSKHLTKTHPNWNIINYSNIGSIPTAILHQAFEFLEVDIEAVGVEAGISQRLGMTQKRFQHITDHVDAQFVDVSHIIWRLRMKKSQTEIEYMKKSADLISQARQQCLDELEVGMTYREIARLFSKEVLHAGADRPAFTILGSASQSEITELPNNIYRVLFPEISTKPNEILFFDAGAFVQTHTVDYNRWAVFGQVDPEVADYHEIVKNVSNKMGNAIAPGVKCSELYDIAINELKKADAISEDKVQAGRMGHGQGMYWAEPPSISPEDNTELLEGYVISTEPYAATDDMWLVWEDVWVVTADGSKRITTESPELRVI